MTLRISVLVYCVLLYCVIVYCVLVYCVIVYWVIVYWVIVYCSISQEKREKNCISALKNESPAEKGKLIDYLQIMAMVSSLTTTVGGLQVLSKNGDNMYLEKVITTAAKLDGFITTIIIQA